jgi:hypothetical protein
LFPDLAGGATDLGDQFGAGLLGTVGGVDANHVCPGTEKIDQSLSTADRWTKGCDDFDSTLATHLSLPNQTSSADEQTLCRNHFTAAIA